MALLLPQQITPEKTQPPELTAKQRRDLMKSNFQKMKADAAELASMANDLRDELDKSSVNVLSMDVIRRAEKIEKLARKIKEEAKGY
jgi:ribosome recycling factor